MLHLARSRNGPRGLRPDWLFLLFFFSFDHLAALVMTTIRADAMGEAHLSTIGTLNQVLWAERIVCPAAISAALGMFPFRLGSHCLSPSGMGAGHRNESGYPTQPSGIRRAVQPVSRPAALVLILTGGHVRRAWRSHDSASGSAHSGR